ncbi:cation:proton antiporter [Cupriavidus sp. AU9028]|uniref:cation:proton antiporter n=1 Tax=Cupriavidus sp. AU9028 TaxID=2871157 RepID=UPI001C96B3AB|nr:cation:proton antiporter [Cupriavidus sp. AU9028]MBY4897641.1 cation:proton antiporter [Cupriavidus sp. AU9028]
MNGLSQLFPTWPLAPSGLFWIGLALVGAGLAGEICRLYLRLPRIVGYAVAGLLAGALGRPIVDGTMIGQTRILIDMALAFALFELGHRLSLTWLRANRWLLFTSAGESLLTWGLVTATLQWMGVGPTVAILAGGIAVSTSPTIVLQLKNELRAEGQVTERLLAMAALNSIYAAVIVQLATGWLHSEYGNIGAALLHPLYLLMGSALLAWVVGKLSHAIYGRLASDDGYSFLVLVGMVLFTLALTRLFKLSVPLTLILAGVLFKHQDNQPRVWPAHFGSVGSLLIIVMVVSLGLPLTINDWAIGGVAAIVLVLLRHLAKLAGVMALGSFSGLSMRQCMALGVALGPMSGLAWLLMSDVVRLYPNTGQLLTAIILCALAIEQIAAPVLASWALRYAGEVRPTGGTR